MGQNVKSDVSLRQKASECKGPFRTSVKCAKVDLEWALTKFVFDQDQVPEQLLFEHGVAWGSHLLEGYGCAQVLRANLLRGLGARNEAQAPLRGGQLGLGDSVGEEGVAQRVGLEREPGLRHVEAVFQLQVRMQLKIWRINWEGGGRRGGEREREKRPLQSCRC